MLGQYRDVSGVRLVSGCCECWHCEKIHSAVVCELVISVRCTRYILNWAACRTALSHFTPGCPQGFSSMNNAASVVAWKASVVQWLQTWAWVQSQLWRKATGFGLSATSLIFKRAQHLFHCMGKSAVRYVDYEDYSMTLFLYISVHPHKKGQRMTATEGCRADFADTASLVSPMLSFVTSKSSQSQACCKKLLRQYLQFS